MNPFVCSGDTDGLVSVLYIETVLGNFLPDSCFIVHKNRTRFCYHFLIYEEA